MSETAAQSVVGHVPATSVPVEPGAVPASVRDAHAPSMGGIRGRRMVIQPEAGWPRIDVAELIAYRGLLRFLVWRDLKVRYAQTVLGAGWAVVQPLLSTIIFTVIFGRLAKVPSDGVPYPVFALVAMVPWTYFSTAFAAASLSLTASSNMLTKVYFPRLIIPTTPAIVGLVDMGIAAVLVAGAMAFYGIVPSVWALLVVPLLLAVLVLATIGIGSLLAALNLEYRDVKHLLPFLTQLWMYASPVVYPLSLVPPRFRLLYALNPVAGVIEGLRAALFGRGAMPWDVIAVSSLSAVLCCIVGTMYFRRTEPRFADLV